MEPRSAGNCALSPATSVRQFRMSPRRCIETPVCWKSFHSCANRITGCVTWPDSMLKATSSPTVMRCATTSVAPTHRTPSATSRLISVTPVLASMATLATDRPAAT
ncbi:Uncharacterised protein [Bordetella pertussis]|nr:Uncharacterised protein [Bordetella pertussis]CFP59440.1 Uncharacterised protein [Bordetella pertussis]CFU01653.1 Uncharacterised protein [Bordetella pertussis]CFV97136.1 Uncharacterised protein [Bordetella pertussis]CPO48748.1 Uncharacterised protein [Bordetella pertussis]